MRPVALESARNPAGIQREALARLEARVTEERRRRRHDRESRLRRYLAAPPAVQEAFDKRVRGAIDANLKLQRGAEAESDEDLAAGLEPVMSWDAYLPKLLGSTRQAGVAWDESWQRRANRPQPKPGDPAPYSRDTDPLFDVDLREVWPLIAGDDVPQHGRVSCPNPDHEDRWPACSVREGYFRCFACGAAGSIIDLGALVFGIEARGSGFHEIRGRLLELVGIEERAAA